MGRGDRKTRKGKTAIRSYGNVRPSKKATAGTGKAIVKKTPGSAVKPAAAPAKRPAAGAARSGTAGAAKTAAPKKKA